MEIHNIIMILFVYEKYMPWPRHLLASNHLFKVQIIRYCDFAISRICSILLYFINGHCVFCLTNTVCAGTTVDDHDFKGSGSESESDGNLKLSSTILFST